MKLRSLVWVLVVLVVIMLALPAMSYASWESRPMTVKVDLTAYRESADVTKETCTAGFSIVQNEGRSYFDYIGVWWGGLIKPGYLAEDEFYPSVMVKISVMPEGTTDTTLWVDGISESGAPDWHFYAYEWGDHWGKSFDVAASSGDSIQVNLILKAQKVEPVITGYISTTWSVP